MERNRAIEAFRQGARYAAVAVIGLFLAGALSAPAPAASAPAAVPIRATDLQPFFDGLVPYAIRSGDIAGAGVVVVQNGKIIFAKGYGYSDLTARKPVIPDRTLFRPGSVSKLFTWTAVMQQVQAGKLNLDADVNTYLDFKIPPKYGKPITLRNLMTHTPGFEEVIRDLFVEKSNQLYPLGKYLKEHIPGRIFPPGKVIAYSNYGAALAGYIVQRVSGQPFDQYVANNIFKPLGMDRSTFAQPLPANLQPFMADGYTTASAQKPTPFEFVEAAPAGAATATITDMAKFMIAYLNGGSYNGRSILKPATVAEMFTPQVLPAPGMNGFDLGFYQENRNGQMIVGHAGDTGVFHSDLHLLPKDHLGIFMSFNSAGKNGSVENVRTQIFREFLNRYFPYTPPAEETVADPQRDAARVSGWYQSSRREERALQFVYALSQSGVSAHKDGTIEVSMLTDPAGDPLRWREVSPLYYRQVNGQAHLKFTADASGHVVGWTSDAFIPVFVFQRVDGLKSLGALKTMLICFVAVLIISLIGRLIAWYVRWRYKLPLEISQSENWIHWAARIGAVLFLGTIAGWVLALSGGSLLSPTLVTKITILYVAGVLAIIGGLAMIAEAGLRVAHGPGGWLARTGEIVVALAAIYGIWFFLAFGLVNFVTNF